MIERAPFRMIGVILGTLTGRDFRVALVDQVRNLDNGKSYRVTTTNSPPLRVWRTMVWEVGFLGLSKPSPLLILVAPDEERARETHRIVRVVTEQFPVSVWEMTSSKRDLILDTASNPTAEWQRVVETIRKEFIGAFTVGETPDSVGAGDSAPTGSEEDAVRRLATTIVAVASKCADAVWTDSRDEPEKRSRHTRVFQEFLFFLMHCACRWIFGKYGPGEVEGKKMQTELGALVCEDVTSAFSQVHPEHRETLKTTFFELLNAREMLYSDNEATRSMDRDTRWNRLFQQITDNVVDACGRPHDVAVRERAKNAALWALDVVKSKELVKLTAIKEATTGPHESISAGDSNESLTAGYLASTEPEEGAMLQLARTMATVAGKCADAVCEDSRDDPSERVRHVEVFREFLYFLTYYLARWIFSQYGPSEAAGKEKMRNEFATLVSVLGTFSQARPEDRATLQAGCYEMLRVRWKQYSDNETTGDMDKDARWNRLSEQVTYNVALACSRPHDVTVRERAKNAAYWAVDGVKWKELVNAASKDR
jgi:hypothetical protein